jgi:purine-binding chemotaxis protein CheW
VVGAVVDSVSDVMQFNDQAIQPAPEMSASVIDTSYITGIANVNERLLILMDIESLMSSAEMGLINSLAAG